MFGYFWLFGYLCRLWFQIVNSEYIVRFWFCDFIGFLWNFIYTNEKKWKWWESVSSSLHQKPKPFHDDFHFTMFLLNQQQSVQGAFISVLSCDALVNITCKYLWCLNFYFNFLARNNTKCYITQCMLKTWIYNNL